MSNMGKIIGVFSLAGALVFGFAGVSMAQHGHGSGHGGTGMPAQGSGGGSHSMSMMNRPLQSVTVDGYKVSLDIMEMSMHMPMQKSKGNPPPQGYDNSKSHAIMVMIQDTTSKEIITDAQVTCTIVAPGGEKESGKLQWSGDHYGKGFEPKGKGAYQVLLKMEGGGMERMIKVIKG